MGRLVQITERRPDGDPCLGRPPNRVAAAMQEAIRAAGLGDDLAEAAFQLNAAIGFPIVTTGFLRCWLTGVEEPRARILVETLRLAPIEDAVRILTGLVS